jgi:hypothetical protein
MLYILVIYNNIKGYVLTICYRFLEITYNSTYNRGIYNVFFYFRFLSYKYNYK